ncbi:MAG: hypothetical protein KAY37_14415, partial [Phycisphaerae bacterium]|nr:hypothetical protein [Phycisphaerae bacterium]
TLIIERCDTPEPSACAGWLGPAAARVCQDCGVDAAAAGVKFSGMRLRSWDFKQCVEVDDPELEGYVVVPAKLSRALLKAARKSGANLLRPVTVERLDLGESCATLSLSNGRRVEGQVVLIADGGVSQTAGLTRLGPAWQVARVHTCAAATYKTKGSRGELDVVLGGGRGLRLATITRGRAGIRVTLRTHDNTSPAVEQLKTFVEAARAAGVLPRGFDAAPVEMACLAGVALEMESHVSKRCLLIGDAGGFVAAFSNEGLYPALRSGRLGAETVAGALVAPVLQDELATFSSTWRADLAEYLRMPNTDLGLLLPMVFNNPQMSRRVARAFLLGQAF